MEPFLLHGTRFAAQVEAFLDISKLPLIQELLTWLQGAGIIHELSK